MPARHDASQIIEQQISLLKDLRKLSRRPLFLETTKLIIGQISNGSVQENGHELVPPQPNWDTGLKTAVLVALPNVRGEFTYREVVTVMLQNGYEFQTRDPRNAVNGVLRHLVEKGALVEVRKGIAGRASVYRHAASQSGA
jgi:hypothetical protein